MLHCIIRDVTPDNFHISLLSNMGVQWERGLTKWFDTATFVDYVIYATRKGTQWSGSWFCMSVYPAFKTNSNHCLDLSWSCLPITQTNHFVNSQMVHLYTIVVLNYIVWIVVHQVLLKSSWTVISWQHHYWVTGSRTTKLYIFSDFILFLFCFDDTGVLFCTSLNKTRLSFCVQLLACVCCVKLSNVSSLYVPALHHRIKTGLRFYRRLFSHPLVK